MVEQMQEMEEEIERIQIVVFGQAIKSTKKHTTIIEEINNKTKQPTVQELRKYTEKLKVSCFVT
jgi:hypothetical protein